MVSTKATQEKQRNTAQDALVVFILFIAAAFVAYLFRLLIARNLSLADYGFFFSIIALFGIVNTFRDLGLGQSASFFIPRYVAKKEYGKLNNFISKIVNIELWTSILSMLLIIALSDILITHYFHYGTAMTLVIFSIAYLFNSFELNLQVFFNAFQEQKTYAMHNLLRSVLVLVLAWIALLLSPGNINALVISQIVAYFIIFVVFGYIFLKKIFPMFAGRKKKDIVVSDVFKFGIAATGAYLAYFLITSTDTLLLTYMTDLEQVGLYNAALPIVTLILYMTLALSSVLTPRIAELWVKKDSSTIRFLWEKSIKYVFIVTLPLVGALVLYPELALRILFGAKFVAAAPALIILAIGTIFFSLAQVNIGFLLSISGPKKNLVIYAIVTVINIVLNLLLIPYYSISGAALATSISYVIMFVLSTIILLTIIKVKFPIRNFILIPLSAAAFTLSVHYLKQLLDLPTFFEVVVVLGLSCLLYGALLLLLRVLTVSEIKETVQSLLRRSAKK